MVGIRVDAERSPAGRQGAGGPAGALKSAARSAMERHPDLIRNVLTLVGTTGVSVVLGFGYWNVAARLFSQAAVGYGTAAISAMTLLSTFGTFGLNTLMVGELPKRTKRTGLIAAAVIAAALGAMVLALGFVAIAPRITSHYDDVAGSAGTIAIFCCGVGLSAACIVFDSAMIGLLRGELQFARNLAFVITKMVTLVGVALLLHYATGIGLFASWVAAMPVSLVIVAVRLRLRAGHLAAPWPDWPLLRSLLPSLFAHNWLNFALQVPTLVVPVIAASILPPATNGAYYIAITVASVLFILPAHMSTVLFALGAADRAALPARLRFSLRVAVTVSLAGVAVIGLGAHLILGLFGAGYARVAAVPMQITVLTCLPAIANSFYIAVARATGRLSRAAALVTAFTVVEVAAAVAGAEIDGVIGLCTAQLAATVLQALVTGPMVFRAAIDPGRHRQARAADAARRGQPAPAAAGHEARQLAALAVLQSLAIPSTVRMSAITEDGDEGPAPQRPVPAP